MGGGALGPCCQPKYLYVLKVYGGAGCGGFVFSRFSLPLWSTPKADNTGSVLDMEFPFPSLPFLFALLALCKQRTGSSDIQNLSMVHLQRRSKLQPENTGLVPQWLISKLRTLIDGSVSSDSKSLKHKSLLHEDNTG